MALRLRDRRTAEFRPVELRPHMGVYVCGITPYDSAHLGHAFTYVQFDVLVRYLRHLGAEVTHVQNVTDVDDDILRVARERGVDFRELAEGEVARFEEDMAAIGVTPPTHSPRATAFVPQMIEEVRGLLDAGHAYQRDGFVYFRVESFPTYGSACGYNRELMLELAAERGGHPEDPRKDDPLDFVLWQPSAEDEPTWDSPWGPGRPGWHIECSTMARRLLGRPVDIHGGGSDLLFPHHESEIAQAEALPDGRPFVLQWVHTGAVGMAGTKMSKSLGNLAFVRDLLERFDGPVLRAFLLRHHYAEDWDFAEEDLRDYAAGLVDGSLPVDPMSGPRGRDAFFAALDDDLDTPEALAVLDRAAAAGDDDVVVEGRSLLGLRPVAAPTPAS